LHQAQPRSCIGLLKVAGISVSPDQPQAAGFGNVSMTTEALLRVQSSFEALSS
jgi:hypothetical protein